mmetsp:Transcript_87234/g.247740  ORF Transcript_87234/g.247740 Transcript_87234/m.247740 type:complete len:256 (-) Transcript_87234:192-959(-)
MPAPAGKVQAGFTVFVDAVDVDALFDEKRNHGDMAVLHSQSERRNGAVLLAQVRPLLNTGADDVEVPPSACVVEDRVARLVHRVNGHARVETLNETAQVAGVGSLCEIDKRRVDLLQLLQEIRLRFDTRHQRSHTALHPRQQPSLRRARRQVQERIRHAVPNCLLASATLVLVAHNSIFELRHGGGALLLLAHLRQPAKQRVAPSGTRLGLHLLKLRFGCERLAGIGHVLCVPRLALAHVELLFQAHDAALVLLL